MNEYPTLSHQEVVLYRKVGIEGWRWYRWERLDNGDALYTGCVPSGTFSKGPRKGMPRFTGGTQKMRFVVTKAELEEERQRYISDTGNCPNCYGTGQEVAGWSKNEGMRYRNCSDCGATGRALRKTA